MDGQGVAVVASRNGDSADFVAAIANDVPADGDMVASRTLVTDVEMITAYSVVADRDRQCSTVKIIETCVRDGRSLRFIDNLCSGADPV